ncbi:hypothetical protein M2133_001190 [Parabacteroides sp. PF5-6]|nr:hypothetical protein [Parabacteroides sp. PF5-6]
MGGGTPGLSVGRYGKNGVGISWKDFAAKVKGLKIIKRIYINEELADLQFDLSNLQKELLDLQFVGGMGELGVNEE